MVWGKPSRLWLSSSISSFATTGCWCCVRSVCATTGRCTWNQCREAKQSEFLLEDSFPWGLVRRIGVGNNIVYGQVLNALQQQEHKPTVEVKTDWYY
ncbi:DarT ssDNA thymidine ADP-ribosyltransferase family protein [Candidatus Accumulibacter phosphatis]|uniref:DarT ssDNA thymidine ADP-ribosyltransferase family protein n=1 Tax=Candidatus Accumulibacter phosphatis TaxID=327160 RepID=UPI001FECF110|nr:DarT ssDNA thymidine ADP-ribosyltransferase family protein [Candidatus Accumulibacter phosphatis]